MWTVRHNALHVDGSAKHYRLLVDGEPSFVRRLEDLDVFNQTLFLALDEDRPHELASMVEGAEDAFLEAAGRHAPEEMVPIHLDRSITAAQLVAFQVERTARARLGHGGRDRPDDRCGSCSSPYARPVELAVGNYFRPDLREGDTDGLLADGVPPHVFSVEDGLLRGQPAEPDATYTCSTHGSAMAHLLWIWRRLDAVEAGLPVAGDQPQLIDGFRFPAR